MAVLGLIFETRRRSQERLEAEKAKKVHQLSEVDGLSGSIKRAQEHVSRLIHDPDDPGALARHWRKDRNSVKLKLAQIQTDLDQLKSIPILSVPAGQAGTASVQDVISALNIAKHALELENEPISRVQWSASATPFGTQSTPKPGWPSFVLVLFVED